MPCVTRRQFIAGFAGICVWVGSVRSFAAAEGGYARLVSLLYPEDFNEEIGSHYRVQRDADAASVARRLGQKFPPQLQSESRDEALGRIYIDALRDYDEGRLIDIKGWLLPEGVVLLNAHVFSKS